MNLNTLLSVYAIGSNKIKKTKLLENRIKIIIPNRLETKLAISTVKNTLNGFILVMCQNIMLSKATAIMSATAEEVKYDTVGYAKNAAAPIGTLA